MQQFFIVRIVGFSLLLRAAVALSTLSILGCRGINKEILMNLEFKMGDCVLTDIFDGCAAPIGSQKCWFVAIDEFSIIGLKLEGNNDQEATVTIWTKTDFIKYPDVMAWIKPLSSKKPNVNFVIETPNSVPVCLKIGVLLSLRMLSRKYPHDSERCNARHYVQYWIHGATYGNLRSRYYLPIDNICPLAADIDSSSATNPDFVLLNRRNQVYRVSYFTLSTLDFKKGDCVLTEVFDGCAAPARSTACWFVAIDEFSIVGLRVEGETSREAIVWEWTSEDFEVYSHVKAWIKPLDPSKPNVNFVKNSIGETKWLGLGILLANRMSGYKYPYDPKSCNGRHYVEYWIHGKAYESSGNPPQLPMAYYCPLAAKIVDLSAITRNFLLLTPRNIDYQVPFNTLSTLKFKTGDCVQTDMFDDCAAPAGSTACWFVAVDELSIIGLRLVEGSNGAEATVTQWTRKDFQRFPTVQAWIKPLDPSRPSINYLKETPGGEEKCLRLGVITALRMLGLTFSHDPKKCCGRHYVEYWIHGVTYGKRDHPYYKPMGKSCPLAGKIDRSVRAAPFFLWDRLLNKYELPASNKMMKTQETNFKRPHIYY